MNIVLITVLISFVSAIDAKEYYALFEDVHPTWHIFYTLKVNSTSTDTVYTVDEGENAIVLKQYIIPITDLLKVLPEPSLNFPLKIYQKTSGNVTILNFDKLPNPILVAPGHVISGNEFYYTIDDIKGCDGNPINIQDYYGREDLEISIPDSGSLWFVSCNIEKNNDTETGGSLGAIKIVIKYGITEGTNLASTNQGKDLISIRTSNNLKDLYLRGYQLAKVYFCERTEDNIWKIPPADRKTKIKSFTISQMEIV